MNYADTHIGQRVVVITNRSYPDTYVGRAGWITARYQGVDSDHGTVEVKLDEEVYGPRTPGWMEHTHMGVDQLESEDAVARRTLSQSWGNQ